MCVEAIVRLRAHQPSAPARGFALCMDFCHRDKANSGPLTAAGQARPKTSVDNIIQKTLTMMNVLA